MTSTLVLGERDALLVDAQFIKSEAERLVRTIRESGRQLKTVYITHAHPDHVFGLSVIHEAYPNAEILAHPSVVAEIKELWPKKHAQWKPVFGADLSDTQVDITPHDKPTLSLEGRTLQLLGPEPADAENLISVYVPDASTLIASDASYAGTHVWLADAKPEQWDRWVQTLEKLQALNASRVVSGHRAPDRADDPADLLATRDYIQDFKNAVANAESPDEVVQQMNAKYSERKLPMVLDFAAKAAFAGAAH